MSITVLFSPEKRRRTDDVLTIGFVGRLSPEKKVRDLYGIEQALFKAGVKKFRISVVGDGSERAWLEANLKHVECLGLLFGEDLSRAYANMDIFAFPSQTDTFGNVVLEAMASGVPAVVTNGGGPKYIVNTGVTGFVASDETVFQDRIVQLATDRALAGDMGRRARQYAQCRYWDRVFDGVYDAYEYCLRARRASLSRPVATIQDRSFV